MKIHITFLMRGLLPVLDPQSCPAPAARGLAVSCPPAGVLAVGELSSRALVANCLPVSALADGGVSGGGLAGDWPSPEGPDAEVPVGGKLAAKAGADAIPLTATRTTASAGARPIRIQPPGKSISGIRT